MLSIVFGGVVSVMAFAFGSGSFDKLRDYNFDYEGWEVKPFTLNWFLGDFSPGLSAYCVSHDWSVCDHHRAAQKGSSGGLEGFWNFLALVGKNFAALVFSNIRITAPAR